MKRNWRALALAALATSGCIPKAEPPERPAPAKLRQRTQDTQQCHAELRRDGVEFRVLPDRTFAGGCNVVGAVQLKEIGTPVTNLGAMTCPLALRFASWTRDVVQPAAQRRLGVRVVRIESFGTYACRPVNNQAGGRLSEHGRANAVDISAFVMDGGRRISVVDGWNGADGKARDFLRDVHRGGCRQFSVGLGPDANALHRDHFHFDMGPGPYCR